MISREEIYDRLSRVLIDYEEDEASADSDSIV